MAGWGKAMPGASYPTLYVYGTYNGTKGFFRSTDAGATWDKIAGQYLPNNYIFDNVKDIDGDKITEGKVYMILGGNSLVYGGLHAQTRDTANRTTLTACRIAHEG